MYKHSTTHRTLSRRLAALLAVMALLAALALPVYAEALDDATGTAQAEIGDTISDGTVTTENDSTTSEPEQSAEPEQPAPTETPEPTAEPTLTPEPTATATATPVPTVTPTATPEPTEQPQKMYAAKSVDNVQTVSDPVVPDTYTLYFAVPKSWSDYTSVKICAVDTNNSNEQPYTLDMQEADKTKDGRKIYSVFLKKDDHYRWGGLNGLEFHEYNGNTRIGEVVIADVNANPRTWWKTFDPTRNDYIGGDYYDADAKDDEKWSTYTVSHKYFATQKMSFENKTRETLTNVQAWFYEPNEGKLDKVAGPIALNSDGADSGIASGSTATFNIPDGYCSYVQFTWEEGDFQKSSKYYNFYGEDVSGVSGVSDDDKKSFKYSDTRNCFIYTGEGNERWGIENSVLIYYDATFSKLPTTGANDTDGDYSIPKDGQSTVYYRIRKQGETGKNGTMSRIEGTDYYAADVPDGYTQIVFSSYPLSSDSNLANCGDSTKWETIPENYRDTEQCFYADTNDDAVYNKGTRGGYWAPKDTTPRDAEKGKSTDGNQKDVVKVGQGNFVADPATKYISTTLYDYYTDYELNGNSRTDYSENEGPSHRNWVTFREFDQAISDYYKSYDEKEANGNKILYPIYTGHFQPSVNNWGTFFTEIGDKLNLYGFSSNTNSDKYKAFRAANNSAGDEDNSAEGKYDFAFQGIVANTLSENGDLLMNSSTNSNGIYSATTLVEPHFNESFLSGTNSKNAKLGEVYHNVSFPFTKKQIFSDERGVDYWWYDSSKTSLYLREDTSKKQLYLGNDNKSGGTANYVDDRSKNLDSSGRVYHEGQSEVKTEYGFFPFNESLKNQGVASKYNYGYGAKLEIPFSITSDGKVESTTTDANGNKERVPIRYYFSGDDDVWVFIDNKLVLDIGGAHGKVSGILDFSQTENQKDTVTAYVSQVKKNKYVVKGYGPSEESNKEKTKITYTIDPNERDENKKNTTPTIYYQKNTVEIDDLTTGTHTLTMYYMERGMWESNMAIAFNFPDNNELQVQKIVDDKNVNELFAGCFDNQRFFNFTIRNQATHYGTTPAAGDAVTTINLLQPDKSTPVQNFTTTATHAPGTSGENRFIKVDNPPTYLKVTDGTPLLNWFTQFEDLTPAGSNKEKRYGILALDGNQTIDITGMSYLSFDVYVDSDEGDAALSNMYLQLRDSNDNKKGCLGQTFIGGKDLYGQVEMHNRQWITVKLSLDDVKADDGFNKKQVKELRFGCNYPRSIYLRNIVFSSKAVPQTVTGFTTKQQDIADYGSAASGTLKPAVNAQYTSDAEKGTMVVDKNGGFVLKTGETISFKDQFRRGSYLSINEQVDKNLFDTQWTIYEDGMPVKSTKAGQKLTLKDNKSLSLENQTGTAPDDGRIEKVNAEGESAQKDNNHNAYDDKKPSTQNPNDNTIVFRSYANPDATDAEGETQLKVVFVNTVKTGSLTIKKEQDGKGENLDGRTYTFRVRFTNVGGHALEDKAIVEEYTAKVNEPCVINNIPVGTRFTIEEVTPKDGSKLTHASVTGGGSGTMVLSNNTVRGSIVEGVADGENQAVATFTNTKQELLDITGTKVWEDANGTPVTSNLPDIYVQLQRRHKDDSEWEAVEYRANEPYQKITDSYDGMTFSFLGLPAKDYSKNDKPDFEYRVVEGSVDNEGAFRAVEDKGPITIDEKVYSVTYTVSNTAAADKSNAKQTVTITNRQQDPKFTLDITKADAENTKTLLPGVEFTLERLTTDGTGKPVVDSSFKRTGVTNNQGELMLTDSSGEATVTKGFKELEAGTYRLTETKAAMDYNLLSEPIIISFSKDGQCQVGADTPMQANEKEIFTGDAAKGYTLSLTVLNRKTPALPHTGADAPSLWLLIGLPLAVAGLLILVFRYNKKGGRTR